MKLVYKKHVFNARMQRICERAFFFISNYLFILTHWYESENNYRIIRLLYMGVWDQSYLGGGTVYFARTGKLNILQVTKKFCRDWPKKCFRNIPKIFFGTYQQKFSGHTQKLASKHTKNLPDIKKFSLTSRNFRNYTTNFSLHIIFFWNFNVLPNVALIFAPTAEIWGGGTCPTPGPPRPYAHVIIKACHYIKDAVNSVKSVLRIGSAQNKGEPTDVNIAQILHLLNFFWIETLVYIQLRAYQTRTVLAYIFS
jgi:hypothetical protein